MPIIRNLISQKNMEETKQIQKQFLNDTDRSE